MNNILDYSNGYAELSYESEQFDFRALLLEAFQNELKNDNGDVPQKLEELHLSKAVQENPEKYRQICFTTFRTTRFQALYQKFGAWLIDIYFGGKGLIQKTPTARLQLPGANATSFHSDGWYGHGESVKSFWVPLTKVGGGNTLYMSRSLESSRKVTDEIMNAKADLSQINEIAARACDPFEGDFGSILTFSSMSIHGTHRNMSQNCRVTFDFRIASDPNDIGTKPRSNFYSREELDSSSALQEAVSESGVSALRAMSYSNLCGGKSSKAQILLCSAYADANGIEVFGNESEIVVMEHFPVLREYLKGKDKINCVMTFGVDIFDGDIVTAKEILECADNGNCSIIFCAEGIHYHPHGDKQKVLSLCHKKRG